LVSMTELMAGQRWTSEMEPELSVGIVDMIAGRRIHLRFPKCGITRIYAIQNAPLRRIVFHPGDRIQNEHGESMTVDSIESEDGLAAKRERDALLAAVSAARLRLAAMRLIVKGKEF